jgi:hypothetical protein
MSEAPSAPHARLWERPTVTWRVLSLVLSVFPQFALTPMPRLGPGRPEPGADEGTVHFATVVAGRVATRTEEWFGYLSGSGLVVFVLAVAFVLPGLSGRRIAFAAMWSLGLLGVAAGFAAKSSQAGYLCAYCLCYLLAAVVLALGGVRAALAPRTSARSPEGGE